MQSLDSKITQEYYIYFKVFWDLDNDCRKIYRAWNENADILKTVLTESLLTKNSNFFDKVRTNPYEHILCFCIIV